MKKKIILEFHKHPHPHTPTKLKGSFTEDFGKFAIFKLMMVGRVGAGKIFLEKIIHLLMTYNIQNKSFFNSTNKNSDFLVSSKPSQFINFLGNHRNMDKAVVINLTP